MKLKRQYLVGGENKFWNNQGASDIKDTYAKIDQWKRVK